MDWLAFFAAHGIPVATSGPNVSRGNVTIRCPLCGGSDSGQHLSVSLEGKGWRCFRRPREHIGRNPAKLIQLLLGCSWEQAQHMAGRTATVLPMNVADRVRATLQRDEAPRDERTLQMPDEFKEFKWPPKVADRIYYAYMRSRYFNNVWAWARWYDLRFCKDGPFRGRIIFPIKHGGKLVSWTGRAISPNASPRYKVLTDDMERAREIGFEPALGKNTSFLLWYDELMKADADTLILCEGPFDAMRVEYLGWSRGIRATCFFTAAPSKEQVQLLYTLLPRFKYRFLLLDRNTAAQAMRISAELVTLGVVPLSLPAALKDPGEIEDEQRLLDIVLAGRRRRA